MDGAERMKQIQVTRVGSNECVATVLSAEAGAIFSALFPAPGYSAAFPFHALFCAT